MATTDPLVGKTVVMKCVDTDDAQFILDLRNDPELSRYLPRLDISVEQQVEWIREQRERAGDYYFVIWDNSGTRIGTLSIYGIEGGHGENGRLACTGNALQVMEAEYLVNEFTFETLGLDFFVSNVGMENEAPRRMVEYFGGKFFDDEAFFLKGMKVVPARTYKEDYRVSRKKIERLLKIRREQ